MQIDNYFRPVQDYFWQWEDEGQVIAIPGGSTIAYGQSVVDYLELISHQGIPRFGPFLYVVVALSSNKKTLFAEIMSILIRLIKKDNHSYDKKMLDNGLQFMEMLSQLPPAYKEGSLRAQTLQALFENVHNQLGPTKARSVLQKLKFQRSSYSSVMTDKNLALTMFRSDFRILELLQAQFLTVEALINKIASLPPIPENAPIPTLEQEYVSKDFVDELLQHNATFHIGALVKRIWSGLHIPLHSLLPSDQPLGGISDLTNKGDFDKLLISEFANEDLVFMSRLANHEALYIRREIPPAKNNLQRKILIDISIKNWGTPKTIAWAIAVAIAKHPKSDIDCKAWVVGDDFFPVGLDSIDQIILGMQKLSPCLEPSAGLNLFLKEFGKNTNQEVIFITTPETLKLPALQKTMQENLSFFTYWMSASVDGKVSLFKRQQKSKKYVQDLVLPIGELWQKRKANEQPVPVVSEGALLYQYPILFYLNFATSRFLMKDGDHFYAIDKSRNLLRTAQTHPAIPKGGQMIYENLPGHIYQSAIGRMRSGALILLQFNSHNREITLINIPKNEKKMLNFNEWQSTSVPGFYFQEDTFYYVLLRTYWKIDPIEGTIQKIVGPPPEDLVLEMNSCNAELETVRRQPRFWGGVLKNITKVYVNSNGNLVFNNHELILKSDNKIYLTAITNHTLHVMDGSISQSKTTFWFPDGSVIVINKSGMLIFKSADTTIPEFFIPTILEIPLAIASAAEFCGNPYFYHEYLVDQMVEADKMATIWAKYMDRFIKNIVDWKSNK